ncbi:unnamed protein product [Mucor hiemalis]
MSNMQRTVKQATHAFNNESLSLQRVIQKVKPELVKNGEGATNRLVQLKNTATAATGEVKNPAAVLDSLLHKSASIGKNPNNQGYEETFNIYK